MKTPSNIICGAFALLASFALLPRAQAIVPAPDGGYPGGNTAEGQSALFSLTTGVYNTAVGYFSLRTDAQGQFNTAVGAAALLLNVGDPSTGDGILNTAIGAGALLSNTTGSLNTANGAFALFSNTTGMANAATGRYALFSNTIGEENTASGTSALYSNTMGFRNTADGRLALYSNTTGGANSAAGCRSLFSNTTGNYNTAHGYLALTSNTTSDSNTAVGSFSLTGNTTGFGNTAIGAAALLSNMTADENVAIGANALSNNTNGSTNVAIGTGAGGNITSANNVVCVGYSAGGVHQTGDTDVYLANPGLDGESGTVRIGTGDGVHTRMFLAGVRDTTTGHPNAIPVVIDSSGQLGTISSSRRFKHDVESMDKASEAILALKPVTFHYKSDKTNTSQFGLIAEDVAEVNQDLIVRDEKGEIYTVRYDAVNAMLLNEFLKEHRKVEALQTGLAQQQTDFQAAIAQQQKQIDALGATLQKVSAQRLLSKPAPQTVLNNQ